MTEEPSKEFSALCTATGYVVIRWALIERQLDNWVMMIFRACDGSKIRKDVPRSLKPKIEFLRKAFGKIKVLQPFKNEALNLLTQISKISEQRHDFIHGAISKVTPEKVEFSRILYSELHHHVQHKELTAKNFQVLSDSLVETGQRCLMLSFQMIKTIPRPKRAS